MLDPVHGGDLVAAGDDLVDRHFLLDQAFEDIVEHRIGRQGILVRLVGPKLGRRCLGEDVGRNHFARGAERARRDMGVAPRRQRVDLHLVKVLDRIEATIHVAVKRRIADRHFRLVASRHHHRAELVGDRHQDRAARAALQVFLGDAALGSLEHVGESGEEAVDRLTDRHRVIMATERLGAGGGVSQRFLRGIAIGQHDGAHPLLA